MIKTISIFILCCFSDVLHKHKFKQCESLKEFLNFKEVIESFHLEAKMDSLVLLDLNNDFAWHCTGFKWNENYLSINYSPQITQRIKRTDPFYLFKDSCNIYIIQDFRKKGKLIIFSILQPCSNLLSIGKVKTRNKTYVLVELKKYAL